MEILLSIDDLKRMIRAIGCASNDNNENTGIFTVKGLSVDFSKPVYIPSSDKHVNFYGDDAWEYNSKHINR